jgi:hypothetical protein
MKLATKLRGLPVKSLICALALTALLGAGNNVLASDPVGVYALVDKVVFEPNEQAPERVQIWGVFALSKENFGSVYDPPARGFLYFTLPTGKESLAKVEWADLKKIAGTGQVVAFGSRYYLAKARPTVRGKADKPERPDVYPLGIGLVKVRETNHQAQLLLSHRPAAPPAPSAALRPRGAQRAR